MSTQLNSGNDDDEGIVLVQQQQGSTSSDLIFSNQNSTIDEAVVEESSINNKNVENSFGDDEDEEELYFPDEEANDDFILGNEDGHQQQGNNYDDDDDDNDNPDADRDDEDEDEFDEENADDDDDHQRLDQDSSSQNISRRSDQTIAAMNKSNDGGENLQDDDASGGNNESSSSPQKRARGHNNIKNNNNSSSSPVAEHIPLSSVPFRAAVTPADKRFLVLGFLTRILVEQFAEVGRVSMPLDMMLEKILAVCKSSPEFSSSSSSPSSSFFIQDESDLLHILEELEEDYFSGSIDCFATPHSVFGKGHADHYRSALLGLGWTRRSAASHRHRLFNGKGGNGGASGMRVGANNNEGNAEVSIMSEYTINPWRYGMLNFASTATKHSRLLVALIPVDLRTGPSADAQIVEQFYATLRKAVDPNATSPLSIVFIQPYEGVDPSIHNAIGSDILSDGTVVVGGGASSNAKLDQKPNSFFTLETLPPLSEKERGALASLEKDITDICGVEFEKEEEVKSKLLRLGWSRDGLKLIDYLIAEKKVLRYISSFRSNHLFIGIPSRIRFPAFHNKPLFESFSIPSVLSIRIELRRILEKYSVLSEADLHRCLIQTGWKNHRVRRLLLDASIQRKCLVVFDDPFPQGCLVTTLSEGAVDDENNNATTVKRRSRRNAAARNGTEMVSLVCTTLSARRDFEEKSFKKKKEIQSKRSGNPSTSAAAVASTSSLSQHQQHHNLQRVSPRVGPSSSSSTSVPPMTAASSLPPSHQSGFAPPAGFLAVATGNLTSLSQVPHHPDAANFSSSSSSPVSDLERYYRDVEAAILPSRNFEKELLIRVLTRKYKWENRQTQETLLKELCKRRFLEQRQVGRIGKGRILVLLLNPAPPIASLSDSSTSSSAYPIIADSSYPPQNPQSSSASNSVVAARAATSNVPIPDRSALISTHVASSIDPDKFAGFPCSAEFLTFCIDFAAILKDHGGSSPLGVLKSSVFSFLKAMNHWKANDDAREYYTHLLFNKIVLEQRDPRVAQKVYCRFSKHALFDQLIDMLRKRVAIRKNSSDTKIHYLAVDGRAVTVTDFMQLIHTEELQTIQNYLLLLDAAPYADKLTRNEKRFVAEILYKFDSTKTPGEFSTCSTTGMKVIPRATIDLFFAAHDGFGFTSDEQQDIISYLIKKLFLFELNKNFVVQLRLTEEFHRELKKTAIRSKSKFVPSRNGPGHTSVIRRRSRTPPDRASTATANASVQQQQVQQQNYLPPPAVGVGAPNSYHLQQQQQQPAPYAYAIQQQEFFAPPPPPSQIGYYPPPANGFAAPPPAPVQGNGFFAPPPPPSTFAQPQPQQQQAYSYHAPPSQQVYASYDDAFSYSAPSLSAAPVQQQQQQQFVTPPLPPPPPAPSVRLVHLGPTQSPISFPPPLLVSSGRPFLRSLSSRIMLAPPPFYPMKY